MRHARPFAVGLNCALGAELMRPHIAELARIADTLVAAYPNAGLPNAIGEYDEGPDETACMLQRVGAGAGWSTSSAAAAAPRPTTSATSPRRCGRAAAPDPRAAQAMRLAGLEAFELA